MGKCAGANAGLIAGRISVSNLANKRPLLTCCLSASRHLRQGSKRRVRQATQTVAVAMFLAIRWAAFRPGTAPLCSRWLAKCGAVQKGLARPRPFTLRPQKGAGAQI
jgi:hypothetical protein